MLTQNLRLIGTLSLPSKLIHSAARECPRPLELNLLTTTCNIGTRVVRSSWGTKRQNIRVLASLLRVNLRMRTPNLLCATRLVIHIVSGGILS